MNILKHRSNMRTRYCLDDKSSSVPIIHKHEPTHLDINIPTANIKVKDIPRVLLNLQTYLEQPMPHPIICQITHDIDTNIDVQQTWLVSNYGDSQGGGDIFKVCPPNVVLDTSRYYNNIYGFQELTVKNPYGDIDNDMTDNEDNGNNIIKLSAVISEHSKKEMAHNITTRRKYNVQDHGGHVINTALDGNHRETYLSWQFHNIDIHGVQYGCTLEIREYLLHNLHRPKHAKKHMHHFQIMLKVPLVNSKVADKITAFNKLEDLQLLLYRICYICNCNST